MDQVFQSIESLTLTLLLKAKLTFIQILEPTLNNTLEVEEKEASKLEHTQVLLHKVNLIEVQQAINIGAGVYKASRFFNSIEHATNM